MAHIIKKMKTYIRILLIVIYLIGFTLLLPFLFGLLDKLPEFSYALGVIAVLIIVFHIKSGN